MFQIENEHGVVVIVEIDGEHAIHEEERAFAETLSAVRKREFVAGRAALRHAGAGEGAVLADARGAPVMPAGLSGSVSHKAGRAAAIVAPIARGRVGVDLERMVGLRADIARRILTARELARLPEQPAERERAVLRAFSIKEAIYKAIDPFPNVQRYVGFQEVEIVDDTVASALPFVIEIAVREAEGYWLSTARATLRSP